MRIYLALLVIFVAFNRINVKAQTTPYYLGCFRDCYSGFSGSTINQFSNGRDIQFYSLSSSTMTNEICINKCTTYGTFIYASTQYR